jgi:predicted ATPase/class 3 adenylate cyclase/DNA-binding CsgD family transcriptional regulator/tetratricopeptide (TPR) repeat protein
MTEAGLGGIDRADGEVAAPLPAGTVTFLLTDVEGSSRLWERDAQAAATAMTRRQDIICTATRLHRGALPLEQGEGDSSVSVFARASDAAACAVRIQQELGAEEWQSPIEIRLRVALHTGEAELLSDGTYQGAALNRCARLRALGHGGQILLSQATYEVLVDGLSDGNTLRDLGVYRLRDLTRPEHVWQLCHPEVLGAFPPLRSLDAVANNLPVQLTSFVGRESEIEAVSTLLAEHRLVTLTGAGGCGKTRLALQVAPRVADGYADGIWWIDLAPLADPSLVPAALAAVLGVRESPLEPIIDTVVRYLSTRRALVVLDNCEHLIGSCAELAARLVQECLGVTVIATSREPLRVDGETNWPVPSLSLPSDAADSSLGEYEAVRLFVDRARASQRNFSLSAENAPAVTEICARLDGIPLAIELAAARARVLTVDQIAAGLADRFHLLTGGARTALPRQRTLESSVAWSHDLLADDERTVFNRLSVFAGSFTLDAAEAVCADDRIAAERVLDLLSELVDRSMVQVVDDADPQTSRYRLLETMRDYARHKLTDAAEAGSTRDRHLDHYVSFVTRAATGLAGPDLVEWLARIDGELDNVRAALDWSSHSADPGRGARVVGHLSLYWFARSELSVGRARLEATLDDTNGDLTARASALGALCMVNYRVGNMVKGGRFGDEAIALARRLGDASSLGRALYWRAWVRYWGEGDRHTAWAEFEEAATLLREANDRAYQALNAATFAWTRIDTSEAFRARDVLDEGLALTTSGAAPHGRCYCLISLGYLCIIEGRFHDAAKELQEALSLAIDIGDHYAEICARMFLAYMDVFRGRYDEARAECELGLVVALANRSPNGEAFIRSVLAFDEFAQGHLDAAATELGDSFALLGAVMPFFGSLCRAGQARVALAQASLGDARTYAQEAVMLGRSIDWVFGSVWGLVAQAALARADGDAHAAEDLLHEALDIAAPLRRPLICEVLDGLGAALADQDRFEEAARVLRAVESERDAIDCVRYSVERSAHEAVIAGVRDALGPQAFEASWEEGARLSLDDVLSYVRRGRGRRKRPSHGWPSLTPTEVRVVDLVTEGLTNPQIGERMFMSRRTVQSHLAHIFVKLGVSTRAELAALTAERRGTQA